MKYSDENRFRFASLNITGKFYKPTQLQNVATYGMQITFDKIHFHGQQQDTSYGHVRVFPRILLLYLISLVTLKIYVILKVIVYIILY